ncbi:MAG: hypothetical protein ACOYMA_02050 [Bacteroidia bacterium]
MKQKLIILKLATIILSVVCCTPECKKDGVAPAEELPKRYFDALFPYAEKQNMKFLKNGTDTLIFLNLGYKSGNNYTYTQEDCTRKIPLEYKSLLFYDSLQGNSFNLYNYENQYMHTNFRLNFNDIVVYDDNVSDFIGLIEPYVSLKINNITYDSLKYFENAARTHFFYYKTYKTGMIKFKIDTNIFELIPS